MKTPHLRTGFTRLQHLALLVCGLISVGLFHSAQAGPASPEPADVTQPDGTKFKLRLRGDEFFSWHETDAGYAVVKDSADGFWKFARPAADRAEFRAIAAGRVGASDPARLGVRPHALPDAALLRGQIRERQRVLKGEPVERRGGTTSGKGVSGSEDSAEPPPGEPSDEPPPSPIPVSGTKTIKNIVILASFSDHWNSGAGTVLSAKGRVSTSEYSNLFNQVSHTVDGAVGSVRDYYSEVSYGKLTVQSVVTPWVVLPQNEAYYGANNASGNDTNPRQMVADAINAAATAGFDFSQGDSDGDGWVDGLTIIHSGHGEELGGNPAACIWSHQGSMSAVITKNGIQMYRYHTEPALRGNTTSTSIIRIGVICHEMGHFFGLPDLYDYSGATHGLGKWCLMAGGSWNGSDGKRPAHFSAWPKCFLGFVNPVPVHSKTGLSLARVEDNPVVGLLRDGASNGEYFLIENRAKTGFDNDSALYPGMLIYHVDSKSENNDLGTWAHPLVKIEEADGDNSLGSKTASSEAGDIWTSTSGLAGGFRDQTGNQSANAMMYQAAHAYNRTNGTASYSYNRLASFSAAGSTMTCNATTLKADVGSQGTYARYFTVSWPACAEATQYEIQEGAPATLASFSDGAEAEEATYENWHLGGTVKRDSAGKRTGTYSYAMHQYYDSKWGSSVQSLTLRKPFKVTSSTVVSFYLLSHLVTGNGYLQCQISNDNGNTWKTLGSYSGSIDPWSLRSYNYAALNTAGITAGEMCLLRFIANFERGYGWSAFPGYGYALDDISITGTEMSGYGGWTTLASNVAGTSYNLTSKTPGIYAYRVRAYANAAWQGYGTAGETAVSNQLPVAGATTMGVGMNAVANLSAGKLAVHSTDPDNDTLSITAVSGTSTNGGTVTLSGGVVTYTPASGYVGPDSFTYTLSDAYGGSTTGSVTVNVSSGQSFNKVFAGTLPNGDAHLKFFGIPDDRYALDWTHSLTPPLTWLPLQTNQASSFGLIVFTNTPSGSNDYYRTRYVSGP